MEEYIEAHNKNDFVIKEFSNNHVKEFIVSDKNAISWRTSSSDRSSWNGLSIIKKFIYEVFLPRGYPDSVSEDYIWYQLWDTLQACCSTFSGMLAVQSVLKGVGVGRESATPMAAAISWFTKDGVGMISSIVFAWLKGSYLDSDCKKWRLFADVVNDAALCMELSISGLIEQTLPLLCISSALKALVGVAGGATRSALTFHQALRGNTADVAAKDGSQETIVNLLAMSCGIALLDTSPVQTYAWPIMLTLVCLHIFCNFKALKSLRLRKLNESRYLIILQAFMKDGRIPSVEEVNLEESVILGRGPTSTNLCGFRVILGDSICGSLPEDQDIKATIEKNGQLKHLIICNSQQKKISVILHSDATDEEILKGYFHATLVGARLTESGSNEYSRQLEDSCREELDSKFKELTAACVEIGWNTTEHVMYVEKWRCEWPSNRLKIE